MGANGRSMEQSRVVRYLAQSAVSIVIAVGVFAGGVVLAGLLGRHSVGYWSLLGALALPYAYIRGIKFLRWAAAYVVIAALLSLSPIDFTMHSRVRNNVGLHYLPVEYGIAAQDGTINYGCNIPWNPPKTAVVFYY